MELRLKTRSDIEGIYRSCQLIAEMLVQIERRVAPGVTTSELDSWAEAFIRERGAVPAFKGYRGFPATLCLSLNDEIVHGIPCGRELADGDVLKIDVGADLNGKFSDAAKTFQVGLPNNGVSTRILDVTEQALADGINAAVSGAFLTDIGRAIESRILGAGFKVIKDLTGHGVGFAPHEPPTVYNYPVHEEDMRLRNGMVLAIEPMAAVGTDRIYCASDGWTYRTLDGSLSAHFEHTVAIWDGRPVVLTQVGDAVASELFDQRVRS